MSNRLNIRRDQLASFLNNDPDLIRRFEELLLDTGETFPEEIESLKIGQALSDSSRRSGMFDLINAMNRLASAIESKPVSVNDRPETENLVPGNIAILNNIDNLEPANQITDTSI